ncbi:Acetyltransferase (GNAT) family protein [Beijerinckiaceae bacterium RH AL1]|nr:Acetyltransferase (GNAT) family protein [Beijerinckiaceae bacterium RH AL1]
MGAVAPDPLGSPTPLAEHHEVAGFDCGEPALDDWLKTRARKSEGRFVRTYVVCDGTRIAAYVAIAVGSVERASAAKKLQRNAPDPIPVAILARLAVDRRYAGRGLGQDLLQDAFRRIAAVLEIVGVSAVLVHAKSDAARAFSMRCAEFLEYPARSRTLFLPLATIIAAL